jgi:hypothetical protein
LHPWRPAPLTHPEKSRSSCKRFCAARPIGTGHRQDKQVNESHHVSGRRANRDHRRVQANGRVSRV